MARRRVRMMLLFLGIAYWFSRVHRNTRKAAPPVPLREFAARRGSVLASVSAPLETSTAAERERLAPHFTDLDGPVFALVNLPETVKGALFARYSRYPGTLRRLYLDEFAGDAGAGQAWDGDEGARAAQLYERIFLG